MRQEVKWTHLTLPQIVVLLAATGTPAGWGVVKQLLHKHDYRRRKAQKTVAMGDHPHRDAQFKKITLLKQESLAAGDPVLSIDTKKKKLLGNFYRAGKLYTQETIKTLDHDFPSAASGTVIPHGFYDVGRNRGHINLGTRHDTSEFACDSLRHWWLQHGRRQYPNATRLLILCDGGGSNSASRYVFKEGLQALANDLGLEIRLAHYPPYCSKYNPIEHRMFSHVTRACQGVVFQTMGIVKQLMEKTSTAKGLTVTVDLLDKVYETGRKCATDFKETMKLLFDKTMPKWNYRAMPQLT